MNLVIATSDDFELLTSPTENRLAVEQFQERDAPEAELLTTVLNAPVLDTLIKTPSRAPTGFLPTKVSALLPTK